MDPQNNAQNPQQPNEPNTYVCLGACQAVITEEEYNAGLTACGNDTCDLKGQPFVKGHKSEETGKNVSEASQVK